MRRQGVTFVGPIQETGSKEKRKWSFLVMQTGQPLNLEYDVEDEALAARRALLSAPNAFSVPTVKLLHAVHKAIQAAFATGSDAGHAQGAAT
jgi:hypothetical protein